jgi:WD40 repeat protein
MHAMEHGLRDAVRNLCIGHRCAVLLEICSDLHPLLCFLSNTFTALLLYNALIIEHFELVQVWRVAWNPSGSMLAASEDDGSVRLYKMDATGGWRRAVPVPVS